MEFISKQFLNWGRKNRQKHSVEHCRIIMSFGCEGFVFNLYIKVAIWRCHILTLKVYANVARTNHKKIAWAFYISSNMPLHHHHTPQQ